MNLPDLSIRRPVAIVMVFLLVVVLGVVSLGRLSLDLMPKMTIPVAAVITTYEGAGPYEVENMITRPLEESLATVANVTGITSQSMSGTSWVMLEFDWGVNMDFALLDVRERIDLIKGFLPDEAGDPVVIKFDPSMMPVINLALSGNTGQAKLKQIAEDEISPRLERIPGVASVGVAGGLVRQITVDIDQEKLNAYGLSLQNVVQTLQAENLNLPGGYAQTGTLELVVRTLGEFRDPGDIAGINLTTPAGSTVKLSEIAKVTDTFREQTGYVLLNGEPAVSLNIQKEAGANTVDVSRRVRRELEAIRAGLEEGITISVVQDQAEFIQEAIGELRDNAMIGGLLAVFILLLFLRNFASTMIIAVAIPVSIIGAFALIYFGKLTINMMTLGGLALGVGMMVDNSIVVLENTYRLRQEGASLADAARDGASEVGMAITASTLTTMVAFLPVVFTRGLAAQIFRELSLTVSFSLLASLFVALTLVPMLCSKFLRLRKEGVAFEKENPEDAAARGRFYSALRGKYRQALGWALAHKKTVLLLTFIVFAGTLLLIPRIGMEFIPPMDQGEFFVNIQMPRGSMLAETSAVVEQVDAVLAGIPEADTIMVGVGAGGGPGFGGNSPDQARYIVRLRADRNRPVEEILEEVRKGVAPITGATIGVYSASAMFGGMGAQRLSLRIKGDDFDTLSEIAGDLVERLKQVEGAREVSSSLEIGRPELRLAVDRAKASAWGLNAYTIAAQVRTAIEGTTATKLRIDGQEYDVLVRLRRDNLPKIDDLYALTVSTPYGTSVPLREVASFITMQGPVSISREDQQRVVTVTAGVAGTDLGSVSREFQKIANSYPLPPRYSLEIGGEAQEMYEAFGELFLALLLAALFVYMIMAAQFESFIHPFTIMSTVPLAAIGAIWALFLTGHNLSVVSIIGLIMLVGIAVNNGIVLIDYINNLRRRGIKINDAIVEAGAIRLRPILMTSLTTILALVPMSLGIGEGAELSASMGVTVIGGLISSTLLTLVVTPVIYAAFAALGARFRRRRANKDYV